MDGSPRVRILCTVFFGCLSGFVLFVYLFLEWGFGEGVGDGGFVGFFFFFCALSFVLKIQTKGSSPFSVLFVDDTYYAASSTFIPKLSPPNLRFQPILQSVSTAIINRFDKPGSFPFWGKIFLPNLPSLATTTEVLDKLLQGKKQRPWVVAMGGVFHVPEVECFVPKKRAMPELSGVCGVGYVRQPTVL